MKASSAGYRGAAARERCIPIAAVAVAAALVTTACTRVTQTAHSTAAHNIPALDRQIRNAVDAGEGDIEVRELRRRLASNPDDTAARLAIAARYRQSGLPDLAVEHLRIAAARAPHLSELHIRLAEALNDAGASDDAIRVLTAFRDRDPLPPAELVSLLAIYIDRQGRYTQAERHHRDAVMLAPGRAALHNNLGYNLLLQGKPADAAAEFRRAIAIDPRSEFARNNLGTAIASTPGADLNEAVLQWQSVSDPATAHNNLASILIEQTRYPEARHHLEIALSYSRTHAAALGNLALLGELDGQPASAALPPPATRWQRFASGLRRALGGSDAARTPRAAPPAQAASK